MTATLIAAWYRYVHGKLSVGAWKDFICFSPVYCHLVAELFIAFVIGRSGSQVTCG